MTNHTPINATEHLHLLGASTVVLWEILGRLSVTAPSALSDAIVNTLTTPEDRERNGNTRCACGCKYWLQGRCFDCGEPVQP
jgi:hypothetical protein